MRAARFGWSLVAALALASSACATIVRGSRADITFVNAPGDLKAFDEDGQALALEKQDDGKVNGQLGYKTRELTLTSGNASAKVELDTRVSVGYVVVDFLLYMFPMLIDWGTSKWTNFADVDAQVALRRPREMRRRPIPGPPGIAPTRGGAAQRGKCNRGSRTRLAAACVTGAGPAGSRQGVGPGRAAPRAHRRLRQARGARLQELQRRAQA